jgi:predicted HAD superfamily Cof-like phosphohydrolase
LAANNGELVREFHRYFGLPVRDEFTEISSDEIDFRLTLLTEEYLEVMEAFGRPVTVERVPYDTDPDFVEGYKELSDLEYVLHGFDMHLGQKLDEVFAETHRSNMSKLWECECGVEDSTCQQCNGTGEYVKRREDGKILKSPTYSRANIAPILEDN